MAMLLRAFAISDPHSYKLTIKQTLSIKPDRFWMRVQPRQPHERLNVAPITVAVDVAPVAAVAGSGKQFAVLYGSSLGTARDIAEEIAERARVDGFDVVVHAMNKSLESGARPKDKVIVVVTAAYNGRARLGACGRARARRRHVRRRRLDGI